MTREMEASVGRLKETEAKIAALNHAMGLLYTDGVTIAPKASSEGRAHTMGILSGMQYEVQAAEEFFSLLKELDEKKEELDAQTRREVKVLLREAERTRKIPADEYIAYAELVSRAQDAWERAKHENRYALFSPYLQEIVAFNRREAQLWAPEKDPYDVLLDTYEEGLAMDVLEPFFETVRAGVVPLLKQITEKGSRDFAFAHAFYPREKQAILAGKLMELEGVDAGRCALSESEHPFTDSYHNKDVRITTHYYENDFLSSIFSVLHEGGHAIYELGTEDRYNYTALYGGASMGIHESQSRFYENILGRSRAFAGPLLSVCREVFPEQLKGVTEEEFYLAVNRAQPSLIRTEADELTYPLHIMVRYEIEKRLIHGEMEADAVPQAWNDLYEEYLGIRPENDSEGCLQDMHWAGGSFGYFPSYALGSAYGAQMLERMEAEIPELWASVAKGDLSPVTAWLREKIHRHSAFYPPQQLVDEVCGGLQAECYVNYLKNKFSSVYDL